MGNTPPRSVIQSSYREAAGTVTDENGWVTIGGASLARSKLASIVIENGGNTCYIDSVLFAMFATSAQFSSMLTRPLPDGPRSRMQTAIREKFRDKLEAAE